MKTFAVAIAMLFVAAPFVAAAPPDDPRARAAIALSLASRSAPPGHVCPPGCDCGCREGSPCTCDLKERRRQIMERSKRLREAGHTVKVMSSVQARAPMRQIRTVRQRAAPVQVFRGFGGGGFRGGFGGGGCAGGG